MQPVSNEQIMADLARILRNFDGREYSGPIDAHTRFFADLNLASIDAVVLGERITEHYGQRLPFNAFLAEVGRRQQRDAELGELVHFLHHHLNSRSPGV